MSTEQENNGLDHLRELRKLTDARIALGRTGVSIPIQESLAFKMAHANARDAVHESLSLEKVSNILLQLNHPFLQLQSQALNRSAYLLRPDLGRKLDEASLAKMNEEIKGETFDVCITIADGLSALAIHNHLSGFLMELFPLLLKIPLKIAPICIVQQGRVAISDEIGLLSNAKLSIILIGERPGLSSPDSLGIYLTYAPKVGTTDDQRNCISNIRMGGLSYHEAATKLLFLITESLHIQMSGVALKDNENKNRLST
jgi:ethanolamine ammonia-lyase small subunit